MNQTIQDLKNRRSVRHFMPHQIKDEELMEVLQAGMNAPSASNEQTPIFIAVQNKEWIDRLRELNSNIAVTLGHASKDYDTFYGAPTVILVLAKNESCPVEDASLALGNMFNAAYAMGLGSCWIHRIKETFEHDLGRQLLKECGYEGDYIGVGSCILGYPSKGFPAPLERKSDYYKIVK